MLDQSSIDRVAELIGLKKKPEAPKPLFVDSTPYKAPSFQPQAQANASSLIEQGKQRVGQIVQNVKTAPQRYGLDNPVSITQTPEGERSVAISPAFQNTVAGFAGMAAPQKIAKALVPTTKKEATPLFTGFKDLSTTLLEKLQGKSKVSKQYISDLTNAAELRQPEKELIRKALMTEGDNVNVVEFANKVKEEELLPLTTTKEIKRDMSARQPDGAVLFQNGFRYENISLPHELRGPVANYSERVYQSPISTSAGSVHFSSKDFPSYFAHTRVEDLPDNLDMNYPTVAAKEKALREGPSSTRRIIEIQSDLFQKGRLEGESRVGDQSKIDYNNPNAVGQYQELTRKREAELSKLEPYRNTWQDRIVREEIKQAAIDGKTKLQFPTGDTAMKIEGLGQPAVWREATDEGLGRNLTAADELTVGQQIGRAGAGNDLWIITDVLGDGKFKAVPRKAMDNFNRTTGRYETDTIEGILKYIKGNPDASVIETFDISGKVDQSNPIYKFYEKELGRYLTNKHGATRIKDAQGVEWYEIPIKPELKDKPVLAFGKTTLGTLLGGATASGAITANEALSKSEYNKPLTPTPKAVIRGVPVHSNEVMLSKQAIFSEVSNRGSEIEPLTMLNVAINQAKRTGRPLSEILTDKNFFQGVANKRYATSTNPEKLNPQEKEVWDFVSRIVDNAMSGELVDNTNGANHFVHITQGPHKDEVVSLNEEEFAHYWKGLKSSKEKTQFLEGLLGY